MYRAPCEISEQTAQNARMSFKYYMDHAMRKRDLGMVGERSPRSDCASAQYDPGLHCPPKESLNITECMLGKQRPG